MAGPGRTLPDRAGRAGAGTFPASCRRAARRADPGPRPGRFKPCGICAQHDLCGARIGLCHSPSQSPRLRRNGVAGIFQLSFRPDQRCAARNPRPKARARAADLSSGIFARGQCRTEAGRRIGRRCPGSDRWAYARSRLHSIWLRARRRSMNLEITVYQRRFLGRLKQKIRVRHTQAPEIYSLEHLAKIRIDL